MKENLILYDDTTETKTRFISFAGESGRFDLCLLYSDRFFGKVIVLNMLTSRFAIIGTDDLEDDKPLEHAFQLNSDEASELKNFLLPLV